MLDRSDRLACYFDEIGGERGDWWERGNCLLFPGRWVARERPGYDASIWYGACGGWLDAARLLKAAGGPDALFSAECAKAGLEPVDPADAQVGDVALIEVIKLGRPYTLTLGAIRTARHWAIRKDAGITRILASPGRPSPKLAWKV